MKTTTQELADHLQLSYTEANGLLRSLVSLGIAEKVGSIKEPGKRGKGKSVFVIKEDAGDRLNKAIASGRKEEKASDSTD